MAAFLKLADYPYTEKGDLEAPAPEVKSLESISETDSAPPTLMRQDTKLKIGYNSIFITWGKFKAFTTYCGTELHDKKPDTDPMSAMAFVRRIENISFDRLEADRSKKDSLIPAFDLPGEWDDNLRAMFIKTWWNQVVTALVFAQMWFATLYGTLTTIDGDGNENQEEVKGLDLAVIFFLVAQFVEIVLRLLVFGVDHLNWSLYPNHWDPVPPRK